MTRQTYQVRSTPVSPLPKLVAVSSPRIVLTSVDQICVADALANPPEPSEKFFRDLRWLRANA